ncbi:MAG: hypothetical protein FJ271_24940 [Planctomycetes bacterium]|nr:hypothetical protein [Planctomycetota bacterium]
MLIIDCPFWIDYSAGLHAGKPPAMAVLPPSPSALPARRGHGHESEAHPGNDITGLAGDPADFAFELGLSHVFSFQEKKKPEDLSGDLPAG